jgi:uncharacterized protein YndB with AHSA1/START domain
MAKNSVDTEPTARELVITRIFDAPRNIVFKAWSEPEHLMRWWGPHGFTCPVCEMDFRVGGRWRFCMRSPEGNEEWQQGVYREIVEPERIVFSYAFEAVAGASGLSGWTPGHQTTVTVTFAVHEGNKTKLTVHQTNFDIVAVRDDHVRGWNEALDHLADYVVSDSARS